MPDNQPTPTIHNLLGVGIHACEPTAAMELILNAVERKENYTVACLASYSLVAAGDIPSQRLRLNSLSLRVCDGQPVRWALNYFYHTALKQRVYGPELMESLLDQAQSRCWPVYFYGGNPPVLTDLKKRLNERYPQLRVAGIQQGRYKRISLMQQQEIAQEIRGSGARIVFVGLGTPRQDIWLFENKTLVPTVCIGVGAGFDYLAGHLRKPPAWMSQYGLQWLHRLLQEPRRLARRSLVSNTRFVWALLRQKIQGPPALSTQGTAQFVGDA